MQTLTLLLFSLAVIATCATKVNDDLKSNSSEKGLIPLFSTKYTNYYISTYPGTVSEAARYCRMSNRRLLSIETDTEQRDIELELSSHPDVDQVWTSGTRLPDGQWIWGNNIKVTYNNFKDDVYHHDTLKCIMVLGKTSPYRYKWAKENCDAKYQFVCEEVM